MRLLYIFVWCFFIIFFPLTICSHVTCTIPILDGNVVIIYTLLLLQIPMNVFLKMLDWMFELLFFHTAHTHTHTYISSEDMKYIPWVLLYELYTIYAFIFIGKKAAWVFCKHSPLCSIKERKSDGFGATHDDEFYNDSFHFWINYPFKLQ